MMNFFTFAKLVSVIKILNFNSINNSTPIVILTKSSLENI